MALHGSGLDRRLERARRTLATHDGVEPLGEPPSPLPAAGKRPHRNAPIRQTVALQQRPRRDQLLQGRKRERRQEVIGFARHVALGIALEVKLRLVGPAVEQSRHRSLK